MQLLGCSLGPRPSLGLLPGSICLFGLDEGIVTGDQGTIRPDYLISRLPEMSVG
jgi:hypothetical protein